MAASRPLRIIHCFRSPVGGIFRHVRDLVDAHSKAGHQIGILCDSSTGGAHEEALFERIKPKLALGLMRLPIQRSVSPGDLLALYDSYKHIKSLQPDVLHGHGAKGGVLARLIGSVLRVNRYRVARFYSPHGGSLHYDEKRLSGKAVMRLERVQEHFTDGLVFVCDYERRVYEQKVGRPRAPGTVIYNGIDDNEFEPIATVPNGADFLYIGMMRDLKGPDVFINAFELAERMLGRRLSAAMVGDGPDKETYIQAIRDRGLSDRISMDNAMPASVAFSMADIVVVPSRAEAMPYIVLEALAAGKLVLASRVGGIPEILGEQSSALAIPGSAEDLARVMVEARSEAGWRQRVMPPPERFRARFSADVMTSSMLQLYQDTLTKGSKLS
ncbi:glycosyltransferase family 4 protein [Rhizobium sp. FKY42]|uniref:glycosyltransferase family 4 protein n=1 Tax=Rhizobium sp. FKY42 TaxID=2562310 RepID=UPI0010C0DFB9|nr:glycosyltransferase family 4 protein [Rhizobium sp. FKY42]